MYFSIISCILMREEIPGPRPVRTLMWELTSQSQKLRNLILTFSALQSFTKCRTKAQYLTVLHEVVQYSQQGLYTGIEWTRFQMPFKLWVFKILVLFKFLSIHGILVWMMPPQWISPCPRICNIDLIWKKKKRVSFAYVTDGGVLRWDLPGLSKWAWALDECPQWRHRWERWMPCDHGRD